MANRRRLTISHRVLLLRVLDLQGGLVTDAGIERLKAARRGLIVR